MSNRIANFAAAVSCFTCVASLVLAYLIIMPIVVW